jgi:hypothetical protein
VVKEKRKAMPRYCVLHWKHLPLLSTPRGGGLLRGARRFRP